MNLPEKIWAYEESFANQNRKTGWVQSVPTPGVCNPVEYIRADMVAAKDAEIERLKARNEFLEKVAEQAVERANLRAATPDDNGYCELNQSLPVWAHRHPELLGHLKEKENGTEKH